MARESVCECASDVTHHSVCCNVLQCVAVCCSVLQCVAVCYGVLQCVNKCECVIVFCWHLWSSLEFVATKDLFSRI